MMISGLLKSDIAVKVNVQIIDAFVKMRKYISANLIEQDNMKNMLIKHDEFGRYFSWKLEFFDIF